MFVRGSYVQLKTLTLAGAAVMLASSLAIAETVHTNNGPLLVANGDVADTINLTGANTGGLADGTSLVGIELFIDGGVAGGIATAQFLFPATTPLEGRSAGFELFTLAGGGATTAGVTITQIVYRLADGTEVADSGAIALPVAAVTGVQSFSPVTVTYAAGQGAFLWNRIDVTFAFAAAGNKITIDTVSNPEPGTMALFGLGALGLVGLVRRRRKAAAVKTSEA